MSKEEATELLTDVYNKCDAFRDVLEKLELQIRDILPPLNTGHFTISVIHGWLSLPLNCMGLPKASPTISPHAP